MIATMRIVSGIYGAIGVLGGVIFLWYLVFGRSLLTEGIVASTAYIFTVALALVHTAFAAAAAYLIWIRRAIGALVAVTYNAIWIIVPLYAIVALIIGAPERLIEPVGLVELSILIVPGVLSIVILYAWRSRYFIG